MSTISHSQELTALIRNLEARKAEELKSLKAHLRLTGESLKPANLVKSAANELTENKTLRNYLIQAGVGLAVSLVSKKILTASKNNKTSAMIGSLAQLGLKRLTPAQITLIRYGAPLLFGLIVNTIQNRKRKKHE